MTFDFIKITIKSAFRVSSTINFVHYASLGLIYDKKDKR